MSAKTDTGVPARIHPSPNHGERPDGQAIDMLILHYTGMETPEAALRRLCDPRAEVSAHYLVYEDGQIDQLVPESRRAWHAGKSAWKGAEDVNSRSIGIEIVNPGHQGDYPDFPEAQIACAIDLAKDIVSRHAIPPWNVLAHSDIAPDRKLDPGEKFPWDRFAAAGVGHFVTPSGMAGNLFMQEGDEGQPVEAIQSMLALYGYPVPINGIFDASTRMVVAAFQRHFRPSKVDGIVDQSTVQTLYGLLERLPSLDR
ncbi:N-acetylmuramoyl-L-alanine amidase [Roseibium hamelinense]|uniref:N-acetylmuramoyl-L-alanine amidase n=1 Tax=Roseibium hamelinense TaxID=150831 RepID=A0A562TBJ0_9HYPH|nr:N-acetylmuramoyl-L-alanine amidase [Roseibium hamelinense]MTI45448.1 N-acetylmuramoyl-L-alanine amidase [Roseibium hamelinense]TWI90180.1 N-acetylmuramoyl-L-alanine amidase [Roseibium hamelinense]